jgi:L-iditol 2-dehydrogenase
MRAVVVGDDRAPALATVPAPRPRAGEVLVGVRAVALCGSEVEKLAGGSAVPGAVLGHEVSGIVLDGALPAGTRVTVAHHVGCGACARCLSGHETTCLAFAASGLRPGGFAERLVASEAHVASTVLPLPDEVADADGALVEPLACVVRAAASLPAGRGAVVGCGAMGLLFCRLLRARGQGVVALDPDAARMLRALEDADGPAAADDELDFCVVTHPAGLDDALRLLRPGGTCLLFAAEAAPRAVDLDRVYRAELVLRGARSATPDALREALELIRSGAVRVSDLVTDVLPLERFAEGLERYRSGLALKVVFRP